MSRVLSLYADLAALRMRLALARLMLKAGFDPTQPRLPRGVHGGGQWVGDEGGGGSNDNAGAAPAAARSGSKIDLLAEERAGGAHN